MNPNGKITDVAGVTVGHWTDADACTGCTAILLPPGTVGGVDVSGSAPATRDTRLLDPGSWIDEVHALLFTGGSAFGLDAAGGVMRFLEARGVGHRTSAGIVPIVPAAAIYDLQRGSAAVRPGPREGELAAADARTDFRAGAVGAGTGATCAKIGGLAQAVASGIGTASLRFGDLVLGALAVVNPVGDVVDDAGRVVLGRGNPLTSPPAACCPATLLVAVAAGCALPKLACIQAASRIRNGIARSVRPAHTKHDGDVGFFLACGGTAAPDIDYIFALTAELVAAAIRSVAGKAPHEETLT